MKKKGSESEEQVTKCNQLVTLKTNDKTLVKSEIDLSEADIARLIFTVRGEQVMLDRDLATAYQVEVKQMNRQVKRNIERFPDDFMFQLTKDEYDSLKCHFGTSNNRGGDRRALPYAFRQKSNRGFTRLHVLVLGA